MLAVLVISGTLTACGGADGNRIALAEREIAATLLDPAKAQFSEVSVVTWSGGKAVCGKVSGRSFDNLSGQAVRFIHYDPPYHSIVELPSDYQPGPGETGDDLATNRSLWADAWGSTCRAEPAKMS